MQQPCGCQIHKDHVVNAVLGPGIIFLWWVQRRCAMRRQQPGPSYLSHTRTNHMVGNYPKRAKPHAGILLSKEAIVEQFTQKFKSKMDLRSGFWGLQVTQAPCQSLLLDSMPCLSFIIFATRNGFVVLFVFCREKALWRLDHSLCKIPSWSSTSAGHVFNNSSKNWRFFDAKFCSNRKIPPVDRPKIHAQWASIRWTCEKKEERLMVKIIFSPPFSWSFITFFLRAGFLFVAAN